MVSDLKKLINNKKIEQPLYDFVINNRKKETVTINPIDIIIIDGIFALQYPEIRELFDIKIYVDTDADTRILRRIIRDVITRGRTLKSVIVQYNGFVKPMHQAFIEPTKRYANTVTCSDAQREKGTWI